MDIHGTSAQVATAVGHVNNFNSTNGSQTVTLSDTHTLAELKAINNKISGTITLNDYTVALSGSTADVKAAVFSWNFWINLHGKCNINGQ